MLTLVAVHAREPRRGVSVIKSLDNLLCKTFTTACKFSVKTAIPHLSRQRGRVDTDQKVRLRVVYTWAFLDNHQEITDDRKHGLAFCSRFHL